MNATPVRVPNVLEYVEFVDYLAIARKLLEPVLSPELILKMANENMTLTMEIISKKDVTHASVTLAERVIVTCVSSDAEDGRSVTYLTPAAMHDFGMRYGLGVLPRTHIVGTADEITTIGAGISVAGRRAACQAGV